MSILSSISKPADRPIICTITGLAGLGKTTLASTFPKPIFIRIEDGLQSIPMDKRPDAFPLIKKVDDLWAQMTALIKEDHAYKTLVVDSVTELDQMFLQHVIDSDPKEPLSINQAAGGYGGGFNLIAQMHQRLRKAAGILNETKSMHIVFIGHSDTTTIEPPDQEAFTRYDLRLHKKSLPPYADNLDMVAFLKLQTFMQGKKDERKKAISSGKIVMTCHSVASNISKNRYGITEDLVVEKGENPLYGLIPSLIKEATPPLASKPPPKKPRATKTTKDKEVAE